MTPIKMAESKSLGEEMREQHAYIKGLEEELEETRWALHEVVNESMAVMNENRKLKQRVAELEAYIESLSVQAELRALARWTPDQEH